VRREFGAVDRLASFLLLKRCEAAPALCVHDEIILSVAENDAEEAARRLERVMAEAFLRIYPNHPDIGLAEASIGPDWAAAKA